MNKKNILLMGLVAFLSVIATFVFMTYEETNNENKISFGKYEYEEIEKLDSVILFKKTFPHYEYVFHPFSSSKGGPTVVYLTDYTSWHSGGNSLFLEVDGKYTYDVNNTRIFETTEKLICHKEDSYITITNFSIDDESFFYEKNLFLDCLDDD